MQTAEVNVLAMAEFGSGKLAKVLFDIGGVGRGTFPGQTHAFDDEGWSWKEIGTDRWHHSVGVEPTHPMYNAYIHMLEQIDAIAQEVFT